MEISTKLSVVSAFLLLLSGSAFSQDGFGKLGTFVENLAGGACSLVVGGISVGPCGQEYKKALEPLYQKKGGDDDDIRQLTSSLKFCCARAALRACVLDTIKEACGENAESQSDVVLKKMLNSAYDGDICTGTEIYFHAASPICWPEPVQYFAIVVLVASFLVCCCVGILRKCC